MAFDPTDPDTKTALAEAVSTAVAAAQDKATEAATALQANNAKLLLQLREAKKDAQIDPVKHAQLEDRVGELEAMLIGAEKDAKKALKDHAAALDGVSKQIASESGFTTQLLVDNGLTDALVKAGVEPNFLPAVKAMLKSQVQVKAEGANGEGRRALVGDKPLAEYVTTWASSDEGKHFVKAPLNSGGAATGGGGATGVKTTIAAGDKSAFGANLAELAKGTQGSVQVA